MALRLNKKAYNIIAAEIEKAATKDNIAGDVSLGIALKRLRQFNKTKDTPVTEAELKSALADLFTDFNLKVIKNAIRANRPQMITNLPKSVDSSNRDRTANDILRIINQLERVKSQTTVHADAIIMMNFANQKMKQLR